MNNGGFRKITFLTAGLLGISIMILWIVIETSSVIKEVRENTNIDKEEAGSSLTVSVHAGVRG